MKEELKRCETLQSKLPQNIKIEDCVTALAIGYKPTINAKLIIVREVSDLLTALGIEKGERATELLVGDILDRFKFESIEDIARCLRNGRQGIYSEKVYGHLFNMQVFGSWMDEHLDEKYAKREQIIADSKKAKKQNNWDSKEAYHEAIKKGELANKKIDEQKTEKENFESGYNKFKAEYLTRNDYKA